MFSLQVRHLLERATLLTAPPETSVYDAACLMQANGSGAVLVIKDEDRLIGIFTERDVVFRVVARARRHRAKSVNFDAADVGRPGHLESRALRLQTAIPSEPVKIS